MNIRTSRSHRRGLNRPTRLAIVVGLTLLPLSLLAQQAAQQSGASKSLLSGGAATAVPFTGRVGRTKC
jgi:hypothetical protein